MTTWKSGIFVGNGTVRGCFASGAVHRFQVLPGQQLLATFVLAGLVLSSGCVGAKSDEIIGVWTGVQSSSGDSWLADEGTSRVANLSPEWRLKLEFQAKSFVATLSHSGRESLGKSGRFAVKSHNGARWEILLFADMEESPVLLELFFTDSDQMTLQEVGGDDRVAVWQMSRNGLGN